MSRMNLRLAVLLVVFAPACAGSSAPTDAAPATTSAANPPATSTTAATAPAATDTDVCKLENDDAWSACVGKMVEVRGENPKIVAQHPMVAPMAAPGSDAPQIHQSYLDVAGGRQIIVTSRQSDDCKGAKRVKGSLRAIDLGGPAGTKESYRGWSIDNATITCE